MSQRAWRYARICIAIAIGLLICVEAVILADHLNPDPASRGVVVRLRVVSSRGISLEGINGAVLARRAWYTTAAANASRLATTTRPRQRSSNAPPVVHSAGGVAWDQIARCETGGNWQHQTQYDGGLGISHAAWLDFGGRDFAEYGSQATREEQIVVAERIRARYGLSGWGCRRFG